MSAAVSRRIVYVQYTNPAAYPPLEHSSRMLADTGWNVLFLGTGALGAGVLRFPPHANIQVRQMSICPPGWRQKLHYFRFCLWVVAVTLRWRPEWVYGSDLFACPVCLLLSWLPGIRIAYHEHDSPEHSPVSHFMRFVLWCRRALARQAAFCILPNQQRARKFAAETGSADEFCVWNCPRREEVSLECRDVRGPRDRLSILYHGSVVPARLPITLLEALSLLPERIQLRVIGYETVGHLGYVRELKEKAEQLGILQRVEFLGTMARNQVLEWGRISDVGLALMPTSCRSTNLQNMVGASNKAFDCMACGLPLLVSDIPDWRTTYVDPGYALACIPEDPNSIADALRWFLEHPVETRDMGEKGRKRIAADWNYEKQFAPALRQIGANVTAAELRESRTCE